MMKKILFLVLSAFVLLGFNSCKKGANNIPVTEENLIGTWTLSAISVNHGNPLPMGSTWEFRADHTVIADGFDDPWELNGNKILYQGEWWVISSFTANSMTMEALTEEEGEKIYYIYFFVR